MEISIEDEDCIKPYDGLPNVVNIATEDIQLNFKDGAPKVMFKYIHQTNRVQLLCFCGNVVKAQNTLYKCANFTAGKNFCAFQAQKIALDYLSTKGIIKTQYLKGKAATETTPEIPADPMVMPRCTECKRVTLAISANKAYPYIFGKVYFTCSCANTMDRINIEITHPNYAHQFEIEKYLADVEEKRKALNGSVAAGQSVIKKQKTAGVLIDE